MKQDPRSSDIVSTQTYSRLGSHPSANANAAKQQELQSQLQAINEADLAAFDNELKMNGQMQLVPSRWERSGWRYVQAEPGDTKFFAHPNRVNNFGVHAQDK